MPMRYTYIYMYKYLTYHYTKFVLGRQFIITFLK